MVMVEWMNILSTDVWFCSNRRSHVDACILVRYRRARGLSSKFQALSSSLSLLSSCRSASDPASIGFPKKMSFSFENRNPNNTTMGRRRYLYGFCDDHCFRCIWDNNRDYGHRPIYPCKLNTTLARNRPLITIIYVNKLQIK